MKILATIPHFFRTKSNPKHGSAKSDPGLRLSGLRGAILGLHQVAGQARAMLHPPKKRLLPTNPGRTHELDVVICTAGPDHLLDRLDLPAAYYRAHPTGVEPTLLGFECHDVLRAGLDRYDLFCYLEDDLVIQDPWFFAKLAWFATLAGAQRILQPNRFELSASEPVCKLYVDGDLPAKATAKYRGPAAPPELASRVMNQMLSFRTSSNPHSGCFFLTQAQMRHWSEQDFFLDRDTSFVGPMESAATLGVLRCFEPYKPAPECADFLEILHFDNRYLDVQLKFGPVGALEASKPA